MMMRLTFPLLLSRILLLSLILPNEFNLVFPVRGINQNLNRKTLRSESQSEIEDEITQTAELDTNANTDTIKVSIDHQGETETLTESDINNRENSEDESVLASSSTSPSINRANPTPSSSNSYKLNSKQRRKNRRTKRRTRSRKHDNMASSHIQLEQTSAVLPAATNVANTRTGGAAAPRNTAQGNVQTPNAQKQEKTPAITGEDVSKAVETGKNVYGYFGADTKAAVAKSFQGGAGTAALTVGAAAGGY